MESHIRRSVGRYCLALVGLALLFGAPGARADILWTLEGVTFGDGTTAAGTFSINISGNLGTWNVVTNTGSITGNTYTPTINGGLNSTDTVLSLNRPNYDGYLQLTFQYALNSIPAGGVDQIDTSSSYECDGYYNPSIAGCSASATQRLVTAGYVETPEPASLPLIATALAGLLVLRRRPA